MRYPLLVLALALTEGTTQTRADMISYNMTGTIDTTNGSSNPAAGLPFNVGDHVTWTLQYNPSIPSSFDNGSYATYPTSSPAITNIVDQTTGYHFFMQSTTQGYLSLSRNFAGEGTFSVVDSYRPFMNFNYGTSLDLSIAGNLPTVELAYFHLNNIAWDSRVFSYSYNFAIPGGGTETFSFSTSASIAQSPEPGSLTLFLLGAACLSVRGIRRRFGQVG
ncbi:MAG TPA: hypothetical protein VMG10_05635 [Gemmataceae bacterium]|nr:hypothetical protein [Gemmataceae bacterium]